MGVDLIFCAGRTRRYAEIALAHGFAYGCRSDYRPLFPVVFADLDWKGANGPDAARVRERHLAFVRDHRPAIAVAPDVLAASELPAALAYAGRLAAHAGRVVVVPKVFGLIERLPDEPWLVVGYSVPTDYGSAGTAMPLEYGQRPVHLLGGSPGEQLRLAAAFRVTSADGNALIKGARYGTFWTPAGWRGGGRGEPRGTGPDLPYRAFARSCANVAAAWRSRSSSSLAG